MPYRYFLVPIIAFTIIYLCYIFYHDFEPDAIILIVLVGFSVSIFVFQHQINKLWWTRFNVQLNEQEKAWMKQYLSYLEGLNPADLELFYMEVARFTKLQEYILMGSAKAHEELKWMSIGPAIRMKLFQVPEIYDHYIRTVFYPHPFISPKMEYIHVSESHSEDGMLLFSIDQLLQGHLNSDKYFNPALYEWSKIFADNFLGQHSSNLQEIISIVEIQYGTSYDLILKWMGQPELNSNALVTYTYFLNRKLINNKFPDISNKIDKLMA